MILIADFRFMKQPSKNKIRENISPLLSKEGLGVVQSLSTNAAIHVYTLNKSLTDNYENAKTRDNHKVSSFITTPLREPSCPRVFVVNKQQGKILNNIFPARTASKLGLRRLVVLLYFIFSPLLLSAQSSQYFVQQGTLHYELKEYDEAIHYFKQALQFEQASPENYIYLTSSHLLNRRPDLAVESATLGLEEFPESLRLRMMKGEALIQTEIEQAVPLFENVLTEFEDAGREQIQGILRDDIETYLSRIYQQVGVKAFESKKFAEAEEAYRRARVLDPENLSVHNNMAYVLIQQEKWSEAEKALNNGLSLFPSSENLLLMMAQIHEQRKENQEMVSVLERLYMIDESDMNRAALYGKALLGANRADEANLFFLEKIEEYPKELVLYETLLEMNRQRFNQSGVLEVLRLQKEQFPEDEKVLEEYGLELITAQKYAEASAWFDSLAVTKDRPGYAQTAARSWLYDEDLDAAENKYRTYLKRWPGDLSLLTDFGLVLKEGGKIEEAAEIFERVLKEMESPKLRMAYAEITGSYDLKKELLSPLQETLYEGWAQWMLLRDHPDEFQAADAALLIDILGGMIAFYEDRKNLARSEVEAGLQTFRAPNPPLFQVSAELTMVSAELKEIMYYLNRKRPFDEAEAVYSKTLNTYPDSALLMHHLGRLYDQHGHFDKARNRLEKAARLQSDHEETHLYLGKLYDQNGDFNKAVLSFERVLTLNDRNEEAYRSLIRLHQKQGELDVLSNRWLNRFNHQKENPVLREFLIEVLHRSDRFEQARALLD